MSFDEAAKDHSQIPMHDQCEKACTGSDRSVHPSDERRILWKIWSQTGSCTSHHVTRVMTTLTNTASFCVNCSSKKPPRKYLTVIQTCDFQKSVRQCAFPVIHVGDDAEVSDPFRGEVL